MDDHRLIDNEKEKQYEFHVDGKLVKIEYIKSVNGEIFLTHTETPVSLEGSGLASALAEEALKDIEEKKLRLIPMCPFIAAYIRKNPQWQKLVLR